MSLRETLTRRGFLKGVAALTLASCAPGSESTQGSGPEIDLKTSPQYEVSADLKEQDLNAALKKHSKAFVQLAISGASLEQIAPYYIIDMQNRIRLNPAERNSLQSVLNSLTKCGQQGLALQEGSVSEIQGGKIASVLFNNTCVIGWGVGPFGAAFAATQINVRYQKTDNKFRIAGFA